MDLLIPKPASVKKADGVYAIVPATTVEIYPATPEVQGVAEQLAGWLQAATGSDIAVREGTTDSSGQITLRLLQPGNSAHSQLGDEGYYLRVTPDGVLIEALQPAGLFYAAQTLRLLLPPPGKGLAEV